MFRLRFSQTKPISQHSLMMYSKHVLSSGNTLKNFLMKSGLSSFIAHTTSSTDLYADYITGGTSSIPPSTFYVFYQETFFVVVSEVTRIANDFNVNYKGDNKMSDLLSAELYKIQHSLFVKILLICSAFLIFGLFLTNFFLSGFQVNAVMIRNIHTTTFMIHHFCICLFIGTNISIGFENGLSRNALCLGKSRVVFFISKCLTSFFATIFIFLIHSLTILVISLTVGNNLTIYWSTLAWYGFVYLTQYVMITSYFILIAFLVRSSQYTIALGFAYSLVVFIINALSSILFFTIYQYSIMFVPQLHIFFYFNPMYNFNASFLQRSIFICIIHIITTLLVAYFVFSKSDIN